MSQEERYNKSAELSAMKEDVAARNQALYNKSIFIKIATAAVGVAIGAAFMTTPFGPIALVMGGAVGLMAGNGIADMVTLKDRTKLKIDEEYVNSHMSGKNYWGAGYREEVAEHGYSLGGAPSTPAVPRDNKGVGIK